MVRKNPYYGYEQPPVKPRRKYVFHPKYGDTPIKSEYEIGLDEINNSHFTIKKLSYYQETAIPADTSRQNFSLYPRTIYVDIERQCIQCDKWFLFYALEQKYWYEHLGFYVDADCTKCINCRINERGIKKFMMTYQDLVNKENRSEKETRELKQAALELFQRGYLKDVEKIDAIKL